MLIEMDGPRRLDAADLGCPSSRTRLIVGNPLLVQRLKEEPAPARRASMAEAFAAHGLPVPAGAAGVTVSRGAAAPQNKQRKLADVCFTVCASHPASFVAEDGRTLGCLSAAHSAALMGLPKEWRLPKKARDAQRAVGNAIPPALSRAMMRAAALAQRESPQLPAPIPHGSLRRPAHVRCMVAVPLLERSNGRLERLLLGT